MASNGEVAQAPLLDQRPSDELPPRHDDGDVDAEPAIKDEPSDAQPRKKRRLIQTEDKKFLCEAPGCGKKYTRAEHLYRHQQNRTYPELSRVKMLQSLYQVSITQGTNLD